MKVHSLLKVFVGFLVSSPLEILVQFYRCFVIIDPKVIQNNESNIRFQVTKNYVSYQLGTSVQSTDISRKILTHMNHPNEHMISIQVQFWRVVTSQQ